MLDVLTMADMKAPTVWLLSRVASQHLAIPIENVIETMRMQPMEKLAGTPGYVRGVCTIRGIPVPVVDAAWLLFDQQSAPCERLVTVRTDNRTIALATGRVLGLRAIAAQSLTLVPPLLQRATSETIAAIASIDSGLMFFLRTARMVPDAIFDAIPAEGMGG
jgi:purine-binding chemotaxis protein CheW